MVGVLVLNEIQIICENICFKIEIEPNPENGAREFTPSALLKRLNKFKTKLFALVKQYHMVISI